RHHAGKSRVCRALERERGAVALVDEDPDSDTRLHPYLKRLREESGGRGLRVLVDVERGNRVVIVQPRLEDWLIRTVRDGSLRMQDFGLPDGPNALHGEITQRIPSLEKLVRALLSQRSPAMLRLKELIG
ncbi:MAG TPA: hypothetical protein PKE47_15275, partial [Verrucomicrobiota bacterium]|nr:hypothetical protein [Verrucomicrobiota bacterium]